MSGVWVLAGSCSGAFVALNTSLSGSMRCIWLGLLSRASRESGTSKTDSTGLSFIQLLRTTGSCVWSSAIRLYQAFLEAYLAFSQI